jgi:thioredoxin 1
MQEWNQEELEHFLTKKGTGCVYLYTPLCGTCQMASKMLSVVEVMLNSLAIGKINLNYMRDIAEKWEIESVPCLVLIREGCVVSKIYAFQSVPYLLEQIKDTVLS